MIKDHFSKRLKDASRQEDADVLEAQLQKCCFELGIASSQKLSKEQARVLSKKMRESLNALKPNSQSIK